MDHELWLVIVWTLGKRQTQIFVLGITCAVLHLMDPGSHWWGLGDSGSPVDDHIFAPNLSLTHSQFRFIHEDWLVLGRGRIKRLSSYILRSLKQVTYNRNRKWVTLGTTSLVSSLPVFFKVV